MLTAPTDLHDRFLVEGVDIVKVTCRDCRDVTTLPVSRLQSALAHRCVKAA